LPLSAPWRLALFAALVTCLNSYAHLRPFSLGGLAAHLAFAQQNGLRHYFQSHYADQTFKGLYHWNWFDAAMLLPYFAVMILLSIYGIHRYTLCYLYYKYKKNYQPDPPCHFDELPRVTVQLPILSLTG
jgi:hypothetical protein